MDYEGLVVSVAAKVSTALNLETKNQTLAKNIINEAKGKDYSGFKAGMHFALTESERQAQASSASYSALLVYLMNQSHTLFSFFLLLLVASCW